MWKPLLDYQVLRRRVVEQSIEHRAFWLLPEEDEMVWQFTEVEDAPVMRWVSEQQEFVASKNSELNQAALANLTQIDGLQNSIWSVCKLESDQLNFISKETWGFAEPNARERLKAKKENSKCLAVYIRAKGETLSDRKKHPGYPDAITGYLYNRLN